MGRDEVRLGKVVVLRAAAVASGDAPSTISSSLELSELEGLAIAILPRRCIAFVLYLLPLGCKIDLRLCEPFSGLDFGLGVSGSSSSEAFEEELEESSRTIGSCFAPFFETLRVAAFLPDGRPLALLVPVILSGLSGLSGLLFLRCAS